MSGVGTQIRIASARASSAKSVLGTKRPAAIGVAEALAGNVMDVGAALLEGLDLAGVDVDADHGETIVEQRLHQRQPDIAEPDDADGRAAVAEPRDQRFDGRTGHGGVQGRAPQRRAAAMLPPSTVAMPAVVLRASAWATNACATSSAVTSRPSRLPLM